MTHLQASPPCPTVPPSLQDSFLEPRPRNHNTRESRKGIDIFIAKLDHNGEFIWATKAGGTGYDAGNGITALPDGSSIVTGRFSGTAKFGSTTLEALGENADIFIAKLDHNGEFIWATKAGGGHDAGNGITALPDGSSIVTGRFSDNAHFDSGVVQIIGGVLTKANAEALITLQGTDIVIPKGVTSIADAAFENSQLTSVQLPSTLRTIGSAAFSGTKVTSLIIPEGVTSIGDGAFRNTDLSIINIPKGVVSIGDSVFRDTALTSVVIPEGVVSIGPHAFENTPLTTIDLPSTLKTIATLGLVIHI